MLGKMLDRTRDAAGDVELRRDHLARLPHLTVVRCIARIDGGAAFADCRKYPLRSLIPRSFAHDAGDTLVVD